MNHLADSLPASRRALQSLPADKPEPSMLEGDTIDALWIGMADIYGHRWTSAFGTDPETGAGGTWTIGLAGLTAEQVGRGVQACIASSDPWPPTLPEFRAMCLGIPSLAAVRLDLREGAATRAPFSALVWEGIDGFAYRQASREVGERMLRDAYEIAREHVMLGGALPKPAAGAVTHETRKPVPASPEVAAAAIAEARAMLSTRHDGRAAAAGES